MIRVGQRIPDVQLEVFHKDYFERVRLRDRRGHWLMLLFHPADFTFVCPTELAAIAEQQPRLDELEADTISVSTDTLYAHKAWHESSHLVRRISFPMGAAPSGQLSRTFGVYDERTGLAMRATYLIDPDGIGRASKCTTTQSAATRLSSSASLRRQRSCASTARSSAQHPGTTATPCSTPRPT